MAGHALGRDSRHRQAGARGCALWPARRARQSHRRPLRLYVRLGDRGQPAPIQQYLEADPAQAPLPLQDAAIEGRMVQLLVRLIRANTTLCPLPAPSPACREGTGRRCDPRSRLTYRARTQTSYRVPRSMSPDHKRTWFVRTDRFMSSKLQAAILLASAEPIEYNTSSRRFQVSTCQHRPFKRQHNHRPR